MIAPQPICSDSDGGTLCHKGFKITSIPFVLACFTAGTKQHRQHQ